MYEVLLLVQILLIATESDPMSNAPAVVVDRVQNLMTLHSREEGSRMGARGGSDMSTSVRAR
jgi:hypothetical protein